MTQKFLIKMDDKSSVLNYEVIDSNTDNVLYEFIVSKYPNKKITLRRDDKKFSFIIGKKEECGILSSIYEEDGKYFMKNGKSFCQFHL